LTTCNDFLSGIQNPIPTSFIPLRVFSFVCLFFLFLFFLIKNKPTIHIYFKAKPRRTQIIDVILKYVSRSRVRIRKPHFLIAETIILNIIIKIRNYLKISENVYFFLLVVRTILAQAQIALKFSIV